MRSTEPRRANYGEEGVGAGAYGLRRAEARRVGSKGVLDEHFDCSGVIPGGL